MPAVGLAIREAKSTSNGRHLARKAAVLLPHGQRLFDLDANPGDLPGVPAGEQREKRFQRLPRNDVPELHRFQTRRVNAIERSLFLGRGELEHQPTTGLQMQGRRPGVMAHVATQLEPSMSFL